MPRKLERVSRPASHPVSAPVSPDVSRLLAGVLFVFSVVLYARSLGSDLVYDAIVQIGNDPFIHTPGNLIDVLTLRVLGQDVTDFNRPVQLLSLMLDALVWGQRPFGYHLTSVLLHAGTVVLLFQVLRRWLAGPATDWAAGSSSSSSSSSVPAALAAALFSAHPLATEAVAEPSYREDLLAGFFIMAGLWLATGWNGRFAGRPLARAIGVVACAFLAVAAKENGVALVPVLLLFWWRFSRDAPEGRRPWLLLVGAAALAAGMFLALRFALEPATSAIYLEKPARLGGSLTASLALIPRIWALRLGHVVWPTGLSADYSRGAIAGIPLAIALLALAVVVAGMIAGARKSGVVALSAALFWAALLPASNFVPIYRPAADRYMYVPLLGAAGIVAALLSWWWARPRARRLACAVALGLLVALSVASFRRQAVFGSELALWTATAEVEPESFTARNNLGWALLESGRPQEALPQLQKAAALNAARPSGDPYAGAALALQALGEHQRARAAIRRAIEVEPLFADMEALARSRRHSPDQSGGSHR